MHMLLKIEVTKNVSITLPIIESHEMWCQVRLEKKSAKSLIAGQNVVLFKEGAQKPDVVRKGIIQQIKHSKDILSILLNP